MAVYTYIEDKPSFEELYELRSAIDHLSSLVTSLAEDNDTVQRATDLLLCAEEFVKKLKLVLVQN